MTNISIVCSFFNEEDVLQRFIDNITLVCSKISSNYEVIFVDDCSKDNSAEIIKKNIKLNNKIKYLKTTRNFGNASCIVAGLKKSKGDCVVIIDCDLEDPPELILEMYEKYKEGFEIAKKIQNQNPRIPTIVFEDGSFLVEPSDVELTNKINSL